MYGDVGNSIALHSEQTKCAPQDRGQLFGTCIHCYPPINPCSLDKTGQLVGTSQRVGSISHVLNNPAQKVSTFKHSGGAFEASKIFKVQLLLSRAKKTAALQDKDKRQRTFIDLYRSG